MKRAVRCVGLLLGSSLAQPVWIERASEHLAPPLQAQTYRLAPEEWVVFLSVNMESWLPYAFDTLIPVKFQIVAEEGMVAETIFTLPVASEWSGFVVGRFPARLAGQMTALYLSFPDAPTGSLHTRVFWRTGYTPIWIETARTSFQPPVRVRNLTAVLGWASPGDSLWHIAFQPAAVDTSIPIVPYVLRRPKRKPPITHSGGAWYLRGDTSMPFWESGKDPLRYEIPSGAPRQPASDDWYEARSLFSDKKPGERSDRGLIYLFYAKPPLRLHTPTREVWVYPQAGVSFHFIWEGGTWRLLRRLEYQSIWRRR